MYDLYELLVEVYELVQAERTSPPFPPRRRPPAISTQVVAATYLHGIRFAGVFTCFLFFVFCPLASDLSVVCIPGIRLLFNFGARRCTVAAYLFFMLLVFSAFVR